MTTEPALKYPDVERSSGRIRPLAGADREPIRTLLKGTGVFSPAEVTIALELIDIVLTQPGQKDYVIRVHETDGVVDGYYCIGPTPATEGTFDLYWIAVASQRQGEGIGQELNQHAEAEIIRRGGTLIIVETSSRQAYDGTRRFYQKQDYEQLARISDYYAAGDDLVVFGKYVNQNSKGG